MIVKNKGGMGKKMEFEEVELAGKVLILRQN